jgi:HlyD family secretion protein
MKLDKRWLAAGLIVLAIAVPLTVKRFSGKSGTPVDVIVAAEQEVKPSILASGTLAYKVEVNLTAEVTARVRSIAVQEGDTVQEGQLLLRLDPETYNAIIAREEASVRQNRINIDRQRAVVALRKQQYERSQKLATAKLIDQNRLDEDRNQFVVAEADLRSSEEALQRSLAVLSDAREQRSKTEIRAPISGRIVSLPIKAGEVAIPSTASLAGAQLMKIADVSAIQAEVKVDEADVAKITLGQRADVFAAAYPDTAGSILQSHFGDRCAGRSATALWYERTRDHLLRRRSQAIVGTGRSGCHRNAGEKCRQAVRLGRRRRQGPQASHHHRPLG